NDPTVHKRRYLLAVHCDIALARGEADLAERLLREVGALHPSPAELSQEAETNARQLLAWHLLRGAPADAVAAGHVFFDRRPPSGKAMLGWRLLTGIEEVCWAAGEADPTGAESLRK